ncbi:MAG: beta-ketoacyl synthase [Tannerella sp.]|jgi:3-oxoacyl-[acyl-carrier-protein] synthase-1|nr:beta-ketoacyl synthase [Tannerella sp.]
MTTLLSDNIVSALGFTTDENFRKVRSGVSGLRFFDGQQMGVSDPFVASVIDGAALDCAFHALPRATEHRYTRLEKAVILSVADALKGLSIDPADKRVLFILSTTKGNVCLLDSTENEGYEPLQICLWRSAELIAGYFGNPNTPLVVSNACISGACALIAAQRALQAGRYEHVIVAGADMLSRFVIAGFLSFKALSRETCKPFDARRSGLNIGEAAATLVLTEKPAEALRSGEVVLTAGAVCNDANHISGPSRTGEGAYLALRRILSGVDIGELAFVNAHGTATLYNDEMEAIAIHRAALQDIPVTGLKGYFGHALGGAGVLESIVSTRALREGIVLKTSGFDTPGVSRPLRIATHTRPVKGCRCINMLSGFGGCNAAILYTLAGEE